MWSFKRKKIYKVEYKDVYDRYNSCVVKAYDEYGAWRAVERRYASRWRAKCCISIEQLKDA